MRAQTLVSIVFALLTLSANAQKGNDGIPKAKRFNKQKDLLLAQFDCKTDVDDLHTIAAFKTLVSQPEFSDIHYHAVAGTYGVQEGLYVPPNELLELAFGQNWTDAHENFENAVEKVKKLVLATLRDNGNIWIAEAGQSDFSAALIKAVKKDMPKLNSLKRFHVVQHSDWNEKVTDGNSLTYVKENTTYHKIQDGNEVGNGTPGFRSPSYRQWKTKVSDKKLNDVWQLAVDLGLKYNGKDGRYNNEAVAKGGLDFSDLSETCYILGIEDIKDVSGFFERYSSK
ncbi:hypothetical protein [Pseudozobellia thermophila]|uniref:Uncharacterized protein n=1 Tax=Pseudozobellia thermophila TaxID=192903 RepID=A0A1M6J474_9FLAO|nr:hypothetical protein [Pseudozobellia thermophila]SHJ41488.1 hypothetical protein SAMN04488513_104238 [Pseudozobellia thermophila]